MNPVSMHAKSTFRRVSAWISLAAILLIYAPIASATLMAVTGACCTGDQCPIHGNHHPSKETPAQRIDDSPMACDHHGHGASKMQDCSMSCCHTVEQPAVHAHVYVLTPISLAAALIPISSAAPVVSAFVFFTSLSPLAPPPKSLVS